MGKARQSKAKANQSEAIPAAVIEQNTSRQNIDWSQTQTLTDRGIPPLKSPFPSDCTAVERSEIRSMTESRDTQLQYKVKA